MDEPLLASVSGRVATLTLNRPDRHNAISYAMADRLCRLLDEIEVDPAIAAVIVTGAGDRAFSAGADIEEFSGSVREGPEVALRDFVRRGQAMTARIEAFPKPVIAAVNGLAYGGGCEIVEAAHLAVASSRAVFSKAEVRLGMPPTFGGTQRLTRLAGRKRALELLLTGRPFQAEEAVALGIVNGVVAPEALPERARQLAEQIGGHDPGAVAAIITAATRGINLPIAEGLLVEAEQFAKLASGVALRQGLDAWLHRRRG